MQRACKEQSPQSGSADLDEGSVPDLAVQGFDMRGQVHVQQEIILGRRRREKDEDDGFGIFVTLSSPMGFSSDLHLVQQLETRRILGLIELEDDVTDLRFQL